MVPEITARALAERLRQPDPPLLVDVREPHEWQFCRIPGAVLKPMSRLAEWVAELDPAAEIVLQCHSGVRSWQVARYLQTRGFQRVYNLRGGIDAWSVEVDPRVPRY
ncbi:MAG: sulfurtransferase [Anaerolineales bacterium]|nr:sulfurtransferase [Anaerolineales bacterium]